MLTVLLVLLAQPLVSPTGFESTAQMSQSGAPDFTCGNSDPLPDGGNGPYSRYCLFVARQSPWYDGFHGDITISTFGPRYAGYLLFIDNPGATSPGYPVVKVRWDGLISSIAGFEIDNASSGGGMTNRNSYLALVGNSGTLSIPDVFTAGTSPYYDPSKWMLGHYWAGATRFAVRADGALLLAGQIFRMETSDDTLLIKNELPDGGVRVAKLPWVTP